MLMLADEFVSNCPGAKLTLEAEYFKPPTANKLPTTDANRNRIPGQTHPISDDVEAVATPITTNNPASYTAWSAAAWLRAVAHEQHECHWDELAELYADELPSGRAPRTWARMQEVGPS